MPRSTASETTRSFASTTTTAKLRRSKPWDSRDRPMSRENVQRLRSALDAYNREGPEAIIELLDPDVEWIADRSDMGRVTYRGVEGVRRSFEELYEGFDRLQMEVHEL